MTKEEMKKLRQDALDKLNEIAILLKDVPFEIKKNWNNVTKEWTPNPNYHQEQEFLMTVKNICTDLAEGKEKGEVMEYYSSYCW